MICLKENKSEIAILIIMSLLIIGIVVFTIFKVGSSTSSLRNNTPLQNDISPIDSNQSNPTVDIYDEKNNSENKRKKLPDF